MSYCSFPQPTNRTSSCGCAAPPAPRSAITVCGAQARDCGGSVQVQLSLRVPDNVYVKVAGVRQCKDATYIDLQTSPLNKGGSGCGSRDVSMNVDLSRCQAPAGMPIRITDTCLPKNENIIAETCSPQQACCSPPPSSCGSSDGYSGCGSQRRNKYC